MADDGNVVPYFDSDGRATRVPPSSDDAHTITDAYADGTTDDTSAFQAASLSGKRLINILPGIYRVNGLIAIQSNQTWFMPGVRIIQPANAITFKADNKSDWGLLGPFSIEGLGIAAGTAKGIWVIDGKFWRISKPKFSGITGRGLYVDNNVGTGTYHGDAGVIESPQASECDTGIEFTSGGGAEYCTVLAPQIVGCNIGMTVVAGNTIVIGGNISDNVIGVNLTGGANHTHGMFIGTNINHNTQHNVRATQVTNGHTFMGCHAYA